MTMKPSQPIDSTFMAAYAKHLAACIENDHEDNYDWRRFGPRQPAARSVRQIIAAPVLKVLRRAGFVRVVSVKGLLNAGLSFIEPHVAELEWLYRNFSDDESRELLVQVIAYRALGLRHVKLPINTPEHWKLVEEMEKSAKGCETIDAGFMGWQLSKMDLRKIGYPVELFFSPGGVVIDFIQEQYRCSTSDGAIEAEQGDVVVDAGGCWGDTALYFAVKVGTQGKVASFEFLPDNLKIYRRNLEMNPELAARIKLLPHPVWSSSDQELFVNRHGPGTSVSAAPETADATTVRTLSIDRLLERGDLDRVDFIKMDIEGAELQALEGAKAALQRFRPKLGIAVYHRLPDFWEVPQYLASLGLGYKFHLRHFTIHTEETVLFAKV